MSRRPLFLLALATSCLLISACTIGPRVESRFVILKPGQPGTILENVTVPMSSLNGSEHSEQDIGGWVAMPPEHWNAVVEQMRDLTSRQPLPARPID